MSYSLADVKPGVAVEIIGYDGDGDGDGDYEFKFISLGILPGDKVTVQSRSFFGGPISIKHGEFNFFALRFNYAKKILVKLVGA